MLISVGYFTSLLQALGLVQGSYKPAPNLPLTGNGTIAYIPFHDLFGTSNNTDATFDGSASGGNCTVVPYDAPPITDQDFAPFESTIATIYRYRRQQSVNLGSWFVQENWMVPSLFTCASGPQEAEIDVASGWGSVDDARAVLERHWDTFINQTDFDYLASIGINTVRLPIGYWTLGPSFVTDTPFEPYASVYTNSWARVVRTINMASRSGIGVLMDLHGAVGSQNGQAHSGISDGQTRMFNETGNVNKTLHVLTSLAQRLQNVTNVVGIEILNEPENVPELLEFYETAITLMGQQVSPGTSFPLYIHDAFDLERFSDFISNRTDFIVEDHHSYFVFTSQDNSEPASQHTSDVEGPIDEELFQAGSKARGNLVIDEWSCALTDDSLSTQANPNEARREFCTGQMNVYTNTSAGWGFWSYYKEGCETDPGWCFKSAVGQSLPATFFSYDKAPPTDLAQRQRLYIAIESMAIPSDSDILKNFDNVTLAQENQGHGGGTPGNTTVAQQQSLVKGYSDGFLTAKIFAQQGWSRLGFKGQYVEDSLRELSGSIISGNEDYYRNGFDVGLAGGEAFVVATLA
ncbi:glycoside hydrolase family 5 protein [Paxillus rubicundulus Ve08.2h10]|uniref:Unplaced genomic scaffold scaffold_508, whole genome shotgun sequence n=1 Tax=Paxillus rubicundulus Ve08.2h10 TaxID=930991 RepID=A0A0D0D5L9_9AGAM|nr:glycoside hydrolase family 5 protein [Paxillus rubicundulus Ve08.2h10]